MVLSVYPGEEAKVNYLDSCAFCEPLSSMFSTRAASCEQVLRYIIGERYIGDEVAKLYLSNCG